MCSLAFVFGLIVPMFFVLASDLPLICPPQKHCHWRDVKETEEAVIKRGSSEIVSADDVGDAEIEALGAGKTFALRRHFCNAHVNAFVELCIIRVVDLAKSLDGFEIILDLADLPNGILISFIIHIEKGLLGVNFAFLLGLFGIAPLAA